MERQITVELWCDEQCKEYATVGVDEAKELLAKKMTNGYRWQPQAPCLTVSHDDARYAADCRALGIVNCYA